MKVYRMKSNEEWRQYLNTNYWVSNQGRIRGLRGIIKPYPNTSGYLQVGIFFETKIRKKLFLHHVVASCWKDNPNNYKCVHHIDENSQNNHPDNLEWVATRGHNEKRTAKRRQLNRERRGKNIAQVDLETGDIIQIWSTAKLKRSTDFHYPYIRRICNVKNSTQSHHGYGWRYIASNRQLSLF